MRHNAVARVEARNVGKTATLYDAEKIHLASRPWERALVLIELLHDDLKMMPAQDVYRQHSLDDVFGSMLRQVAHSVELHRLTATKKAEYGIPDAVLVAEDDERYE